ncbi:MAG: YihY/virulence factor BrkB family protein [Vicinamibacterales bacterium]
MGSAHVSTPDPAVASDAGRATPRRRLRLVRQAPLLFWRTILLWIERSATRHAAALAFYTLFSLAPLLIILIAIVGAVFGQDAARGEVATQIDHLVGPQAATAVQNAVRQSSISQAGLLPTVLGLLALGFGATTVFAQMQAGLNQFWGVQARPTRSGIGPFLRTRLVSLSLVLVIGFLLLTSLVVSTAISGVVAFARGWVPVPPALVTGVDLCVSLFVVTLLFAMIFKILPDVHLEWGDVWHAAVLTAALFVGGQSLISLYLTRMATASTYGAAGSLVVVLMWVYYSALILYFGAAMTSASMRMRGARVIPKPTAVKVRIEVVEDGAPPRA